MPNQEPLRLITVIEASFELARRAVEGVVPVRNLVRNGWIRLIAIDPETAKLSVYEDGQWQSRARAEATVNVAARDRLASWRT